MGGHDGHADRRHPIHYRHPAVRDRFFIVDNLLGLSPAHKRVWWPILPFAGVWLLSLGVAYAAGGDPRPIDMGAVMFRYVIFGVILIAVAIVVVTGCRNGGCS